MRTPHSTLYRYSPECIAQANRIPVGSHEEQVHKSGMEHGEPLLVAIDCLLKYAEAYREKDGSNLAADKVLGVQWQDALDAIAYLATNGETVQQMKGRGPSLTIEAVDGIYADAMRIAGFEP